MVGEGRGRDGGGEEGAENGLRRKTFVQISPRSDRCKKELTHKGLHFDFWSRSSSGVKIWARLRFFKVSPPPFIPGPGAAAREKGRRDQRAASSASWTWPGDEEAATAKTTRASSATCTTTASTTTTPKDRGGSQKPPPPIGGGRLRGATHL